jgi:hypothetical protein
MGERAFGTWGKDRLARPRSPYSVFGRGFIAERTFGLISQKATLTLDQFAQFNQQTHELGRGVVMCNRPRGREALSVAI